MENDHQRPDDLDMVTIDMVNDKETRERITAVSEAMCDAIPEGATNPDVATACYIILCQVAAYHKFDPRIIEDLKHNLDVSFQQAEVQWQFQEALRGLYEAEVKGHG